MSVSLSSPRYNPRHTHTHKWPPSLPPKEKRGESWNRDKRTHFLYVFLFSCGRQAAVSSSFPSLPLPFFYSSPSSHSFVRQEVGNSTISTYFNFILPENGSNWHSPSRQCWWIPKLSAPLSPFQVSCAEAERGWLLQSPVLTFFWRGGRTKNPENCIFYQPEPVWTLFLRDRKVTSCLFSLVAWLR